MQCLTSPRAQEVLGWQNTAVDFANPTFVRQSLRNLMQMQMRPRLVKVMTDKALNKVLQFYYDHL